MIYHFSLYHWTLLSCATVTMLLALYGWQHRQTVGARAFVVLMTIGALWAASNALELAGLDLPTKLFWANVQYFCTTFGPLTWLVLAIQFTQRGQWLTRRRLLLLCLIPTLTVIVAWTNPWGLLRQNVHLENVGAFSVIAKTYGPWIWVHMLYGDGMLFLAAYLLAEAATRWPPAHRGQPLWMLSALVIPVMFNIGYVVGLSPLKFDVTPLWFGVVGLVGAQGVLRYRVFDLVPLARTTVLENMSDGVLVLDQRDRLMDWNPAACSIVAADRRTIGRPIAESLRGWPGLAELCALNPPQSTEAFVTSPDGARDYDVQVAPLCDIRGQLQGRLVVLRDVTERRRLEHQLQATAMLAEREQLGREMHDALNQVIGYLDLEAQTAQAFLQAGRASEARGSLARLSQVAREARAEVRDFGLGLHVAGLQPRNFGQALAEYLREFNQGSSVQVSLDYPADAPAALFAAAVEDQVLYLVQDALGAIRQRGTAHRAEVIFSFDENSAHIIIADDGVWPAAGSPRADQAAPRPVPPSGLDGLRQRAEQMGGRLEVRRNHGSGPRVIAHIPRLLAGMTLSGDDLVEAKGLRILLVDDHPLFLDGLRTLLTARGLNVVGVAHDGLEAQAQARALCPDVIVMDSDMPRCDGLTATRVIKAELPDVKIIILTTASTSDDPLLAAIQSGATGYLLRNLGANEFIKSLVGLARGEVALAPGLGEKALTELTRLISAGQGSAGKDAAAPPADLTDRQWAVLQRVAQGQTYKEIAAALFISERTVKYTMEQILARLHLENREQAIAYARRMQGRQP